MCPFVHSNYLILFLAVVASMVFGFLWYGPIFGKTWAGLLGLKIEDLKPQPWSYPVTILGSVFTVFVLAYLLNIYKPYCTYGAAFFIWVGFYVPLLLSSVTWEGKPWKLFVLNSAYYLLNLQLIAAVLSFWS